MAKSKKAAAAQDAVVGPVAPVGVGRGTGIARGADLSGYIRGLGRTTSGKPTLDVADAVADALRGKSAEDVAKAARAAITKVTGADPGDLLAKYAHLNPGQIRMNCGNRLRAALKAEQAG